MCVGVESNLVYYVPIFYVTLLSTFSAVSIVMVSDQGGPRKRVSLLAQQFGNQDDDSLLFENKRNLRN